MSDTTKTTKTPADQKNEKAPKSAEIVELDDITLDDVVGGKILPPDDGNGDNCTSNGNCPC